MVIDAFEFCRSMQTASGDLPVAAMARVDAHDRRGGMHWQASGSTGQDGKLFLRLQVTGGLVLECQRCLEHMVHDVAIDTLLQIVRSEQEADAVPLDQDDLDVIVGSREFDLEAFVEDEVILALPLVPTHERCSLPGADGDADQCDRQTGKQDGLSRPSGPFAALGMLRKKRSEK